MSSGASLPPSSMRGPPPRPRATRRRASCGRRLPRASPRQMGTQSAENSQPPAAPTAGGAWTSRAARRARSCRRRRYRHRARLRARALTTRLLCCASELGSANKSELGSANKNKVATAPGCQKSVQRRPHSRPTDARARRVQPGTRGPGKSRRLRRFCAGRRSRGRAEHPPRARAADAPARTPARRGACPSRRGAQRWRGATLARRFRASRPPPSSRSTRAVTARPRTPPPSPTSPSLPGAPRPWTTRPTRPLPRPAAPSRPRRSCSLVPARALPASGPRRGRSRSAAARPASMRRRDAQSPGPRSSARRSVTRFHVRFHVRWSVMHFPVTWSATRLLRVRWSAVRSRAT